MSYISFGNIEKKLLIYFVLYILTLAIDEICYFIRDDKDKNLKNIAIDYLVEFGGSIFYAIPAFLINRKNKELISRDISKEIIADEKAIKFNVYKDSNKICNLKNILILISEFIIYYILYFCKYYRPKKYEEYYPLIFNEFFDPLALVNLYIIFRLIRKTIFYKHQNFSFIFILFSGIISYILLIFFGENEISNFNFIDWLIIIILVIIYPLVYSILLYIAKEYMKYKYYSPYFLCFIVGSIVSFISLLFLLICYNVDYDKSDSCEIIEYTPKFLAILFVRIIINAINYLLKILILNDFSCLHLIIFFLFRANIYAINNIVEKFQNISIINLITKFLQFIFGLIFLEIIELNFWGFNKNLKKNITIRSQKESEKIYELPLDEDFVEIDDNDNKISPNEIYK